MEGQLLTANKPGADITISHDLIHTMLKEFVPELADLPLSLHGEGWDNEIHRLGDDHAVRLPRREQAATLVEHEHRWLPELAPVLPLPIPEPTYAGRPAFGFPWPWSIVPWLPGVPLAHAPTPPDEQLLDDLSGFLNALHVPAPDDAPENPHRGGLLADRAELVHDRIDQIPSTLADLDAVHTTWDELVDTPVWGGDAIWLHGDLHPLNLLVRGGRISAVIDFGDITSGDPATDLSIGWMVFDEPNRNEFRKRSTIDGRSVDIHTWNRSRGWALSHATACLANSADDPTMRRVGTATLTAVMS